MFLMQEQVNAINHNISSLSFHSIYKSLTRSWLAWSFSKSGDVSEALFSSTEANFRLPTSSVFHISPSHFVFSRSRSRYIQTQYNRYLSPNIWLTFPSANVVFVLFFNPHFLSVCYYIHCSLNFLLFSPQLSLIPGWEGLWSFSGKKNATFTFHRLFKLTSTVCVWYFLSQFCICSARSQRCSAARLGYSRPIHDRPFFRRGSPLPLLRRLMDVLTCLVSGCEQMMHGTAPPGIRFVIGSPTCNTQLSVSSSCYWKCLSVTPSVTILQGN